MTVDAAVHWLLPIDPAAHAEHQPADWATRSDATAVWEAIAASQDVGRWCLRSGFRTMQSGDVVWAYLSKRQEVCAVGSVRGVVRESNGWFVDVEWDARRTARLCASPLPRSEFVQIPMSTCRAGEHAAAVLRRRYERDARQ